MVGGVGPIVIAVPGSKEHAARLRTRIDGEIAEIHLRRFPDGEYYVRIDSPVAGREVGLVCSRERPGPKGVPVLFRAAPPRAFRRPDRPFHPGEAVTSSYFSSMLSGVVDWLVTVDPHLHRWASLDEI